MKRVCYSLIVLSTIYLFTFSIDRKVVSENDNYFVPLTGMEEITVLTNRVHKLEIISNIVSTNVIQRIELAILYHNISHNFSKAGFRGYATKSVTILEALYREKQIAVELRPIITAYLGSSKALIGNESINPAEKITAVNDGMKYLNEAYDKYSDISFMSIFMRANVCSTLPDFFNKEKTAMNDYLTLEKKYKENPAYAPKGIMSYVFNSMGNMYKKRKDIKKALQYWNLSISEYPDGSAAKKAKAMIEIFED